MHDLIISKLINTIQLLQVKYYLKYFLPGFKMHMKGIPDIMIIWTMMCLLFEATTEAI